MSETGGVLLDYTTIISAANALNSSEAIYPATTINPYKDLLTGRTTNPDSPMWIDIACLADCLEACVLHEHICVMKAVDNDRILERGRYAIGSSSAISLIDQWSGSGILRDISDEPAGRQDWIEGLLEDPAVVGNLLRSMMRLLKEPVYSTIPDLFSHSQTVYKFDGESLWNVVKTKVNSNDIGRTYRRIAREEEFVPRQRYSSHFYPKTYSVS